MKCILVPIDFSDVTPPVIDLARQLAKALDAEIHLVHVKELTAAATPGALEYGLAGMPELAPMSGVPVPGFEPMAETIPEDEGQTSKLAKWQQDIAQDGIKVSLHEPTGAVAEEILNQADALNTGATSNIFVRGFDLQRLILNAQDALIYVVIPDEVRNLRAADHTIGGGSHNILCVILALIGWSFAALRMTL